MEIATSELGPSKNAIVTERNEPIHFIVFTPKLWPIAIGFWQWKQEFMYAYF